MSETFVASPIMRRFVVKFAYDLAGCWRWTGTKDRKGYGKFFLDGNNAMAHRASYRLFVGPILPGLTVDHLCRNRACVNPLHFELVDSATNVMRGVGFAPVNKAKTHCINGHEFSTENTYLWRGNRKCKSCDRVNHRRQHVEPAR